MKARAHLMGEAINPIKVWEEADTKDELIPKVISRELYNLALATAMTRMILPMLGRDLQPGTWEETHNFHAARHVGETLIGSYIVDYDDGTSETIEINISADAVRNAGVAEELGLM